MELERRLQAEARRVRIEVDDERRHFADVRAEHRSQERPGVSFRGPHAAAGRAHAPSIDARRAPRGRARRQERDRRLAIATQPRARRNHRSNQRPRRLAGVGREQPAPARRDALQRERHALGHRRFVVDGAGQRRMVDQPDVEGDLHVLPEQPPGRVALVYVRLRIESAVETRCPHVFHVLDMGRDPELLAQVAGLPRVARGPIVAPGRGSRRARVGDGHERSADGVERRREAAEAAEHDGCGRQQVDARHAAVAAAVEGSKQVEAPPRAELPGREGRALLQPRLAEVVGSVLEVGRGHVRGSLSPGARRSPPRSARTPAADEQAVAARGRCAHPEAPHR